MANVASTATDLASAALVLVGGAPVMDIDDPQNKNGRTCKAMLQMARRTAFNKHNWNCLTKRVALAACVDTPTFEFDYAYTLPSDCIRVYRIYDEDGYPLNIPYKIEEGKILTNQAAPLYVKYIADTENYSSLDPHVYEVLVHVLAQKICMTVTGKASVYREMTRTLKEIVDEATFIDSSQSTPDQPENVDEFGDARQGYAI